MAEDKFEVVGSGGRIKGAAETFASFPTNPLDCYKYIQEQRKNPDFKYRRAYFPLSENEIKQHLSRLGLYRSTFKTDQGMPGNFSVFRIDPEARGVDEIIFIVEEGLAFPEPHAGLGADVIERVQAAFLTLDLDTTHEIIETIPRRQANKGRQPFFFVRAAIPSKPAIMGADTAAAIAEKTADLVGQAVEHAESQAGVPIETNVVYLQSDAYVTAGGVHIEQIQTPDVGLFFDSLNDIRDSQMLPQAKDVMVSTGKEFVESALLKLEGLHDVYIVTRDDVTAGDSDLLEHGDMQFLAKRLKVAGKDVHLMGVSQLRNLVMGNDKAGVVLMNIDYNDATTNTAVFDAYAKYPGLRFFPNPFVQKALRQLTGLPTTAIEAKHRKVFLDLIKGAPNLDKPQGITNKIKSIRDLLNKAGIMTDIVRVRFGGETIVIPVQASQAWTAVATRIAQHPPETLIHIDAIPLNTINALVRGMRDSADGPRMQVFRTGVVPRN